MFMNEAIVNDWKAAKELQEFKRKYLDPLEKRLEEGRRILQDPNQKWKPDQKERAKQKLAVMDTENIDFRRLYNAVMELIQQHEKQTDLLASAYSRWYSKVSSNGEQPKEMMSMQTEVLQTIFVDLYRAIEPLKLELLPPKTNE